MNDTPREDRPGRQRLLLVLRLSGIPVLVCSGCEGMQSALDPAGQAAEDLARLFYWMAGGAAAIWLVVVGLLVYAIFVTPSAHARRSAVLVIFGGAVFPTIVLAVLLAYGLSLLPRLQAPAPAGSLTVRVVGEQWWWRVSYQTASGQQFETANEIHLPVGQPVEFKLEAADVIHSFWVPPLGGKMDMFPGRETRLRLEPTRTGLYRGACAEYCGASHALMNFYVVVEEPEEFEAWVEAQVQPAQASADDLALVERGRELFLSNGCGACHTVRGTPADGMIGPDLTHVGSRVSLAAGILENHATDFEQWIAQPKRIKPEANMPAFGMLSDEELNAIAAYLNGLE